MTVERRDREAGMPDGVDIKGGKGRSGSCCGGQSRGVWSCLVLVEPENPWDDNLTWCRC
jgi:hypothetical protein